jgi:signal transduction histidine kinase
LLTKDDLVITALLETRAARPRDFAREIAAIQEIASCMLRAPDRMQQCFVDIALSLCDAGSAGISLLEDTEAGETIFRWTALAGSFAGFVGGSTPRDFSPCGICLDSHAPVLVSEPGRLFTYFFEATDIPIIEGLIVPLHDADGTALGTIWIVSHTRARTFDATDVAVVEQIASFFTIAWKMADTVTAQHRALGKVEKKLAKEGARRRRAEEALRQSIKMEAMGQLTGGVAHDFNNLLAVITGSLEIARERATDTKLHQPLERAMAAAKRGERLTGQLLAFARRQSLRPGAVDLSVAVPNVLDMLEPTLRGTISFGAEIARNVWPVFADANALEMALVNICVNARDAMPTGGTLRVRASNITFSNASISTETLSGDYVALTVEDSGTGMPPEVIDRVFEPFFTTKEIGKGTGLGLSTVFGFVKQSAGAVKIDSEVGRGSAVTLYLPRAQPAHAVETPEKEMDRHSAASAANSTLHAN